MTALTAKADPALETSLARARHDRADHVAAILALEIASPDDYAFADELLTECARERDALVAQRGSVTKPLYAVVKTVESWFKPSVDELDKCLTHLKSVMGAWRVQLDKAEREARARALAAAKAQDSPALHAALHEARDAAPAIAAVGRARSRFEWHASEVDVSVLPREYMVPDEKLLARIAHGAGSGEQPPEQIPGVTWSRRAVIGAKR